MGMHLAITEQLELSYSSSLWTVCILLPVLWVMHCFVVKKQILSAQDKAKVLEHLLSACYVLVCHTFTIYRTLPTSCPRRGR